MVILITIITLIVVVAFMVGMNLAYKQGYAVGCLEASMKHTELICKQFPGIQEQARKRLREALYQDHGEEQEE